MKFVEIKNTLYLEIKHISISATMLVLLFSSGCATFHFTWDKNPTIMKPLSIEGVYECSNGTYKGLTSIKRSGEIYHLKWRIGKQEYYGIGIRDGNMLSSSWTDGRGILGIVVYEIESGPRLEGKYSALPGKNNIKTETLTFKSSLSVPPNAESVTL